MSKRQGIYSEKTEFKIYYNWEEVYAKRLKELSPLPDMPGLILYIQPLNMDYCIFKLVVPSTYEVFIFFIREGLPSHRNTPDSNDNIAKFMSTNKKVITFMSFRVYRIPRGMYWAGTKLISTSPVTISLITHLKVMGKYQKEKQNASEMQNTHG